MASSRFGRSALSVALLSSVCVAGCPEPSTPAQVEPEPTSYQPDLPAPPAPNAPADPPPEAGDVRLGAAMLVGWEGMSDEAGDAVTKAFEKAFEQGLFHFRRCYAQGLSRNPSLAGGVDVQVLIRSDGSIENVQRKWQNLDDPATVECVTQAFFKLSYAPFNGRLFSVTAPVRLKPQ